MTDGPTYPPHWHKERRSKEWRRAMYRALTRAGLPFELAMKVRDWSEGHIRLFLEGNAHMLNKAPDAVWADFEEELIRAVNEAKEKVKEVGNE